MIVYSLVHSERFKTGLAQFVRAIQWPLEERIAALEKKLEETGPWPAGFPTSEKELTRLIRAVVREMDRVPESFSTGLHECETGQTVDLDKAISEPATVVGAPYGYCPVCGLVGLNRERRINGNDTCANGHVYPSRDALPGPIHPPAPQPDPDLAERLAREGAELMIRQGVYLPAYKIPRKGKTDEELFHDFLLPLFQRAVRGER